MHDAWDRLDARRQENGFMGIKETLSLVERGIMVLDPFSTLISPRAKLGTNIQIWPGVTLAVGDDGALTIGDGVQLFSAVRIQAQAGRITVGTDADIGQEGGFTILTQ